MQQRLWTRDFLLITTCNLLIFLGFQALTPTLPVYIKQLGGNDFSAGLTISLFTLSAVLIRPLIGKWLDTKSRKAIALISVGILALSTAGFYGLGAVWLILLMRVLHGLGWGAATTSYTTIVSDIIPKNRIGEGMGYFGLSQTLAMAVAPIAGAWLLTEHGFQPLVLTAAVFTAMVLPFTLMTATPSKKMKDGGATAPKTTWFEKRAALPSFLNLFCGITYGGIASFILLFGKEAGIAGIEWFFISNAAAVVLSRPMAGKIFDQKGPAWVLFPSALLMISGLLSLSYATTLFSLNLAAFLYGLGYGSTLSTLLAWTVARVEPRRRGTATGMFISSIDLGIGIGGMLLGYIAAHSSYSAMYRFSSAFPVLLLFLFSYHLWKEKRITCPKVETKDIHHIS
ncbi:MFS transporter [Paludifilum halophilum]|uniref:MFS transporter n=1 Tax=Paludifilum halophilum TaxID=1642702 RepID=UPI00146D17F9|nr:MFS transporter [Paludifilum halophilum]